MMYCVLAGVHKRAVSTVDSEYRETIDRARKSLGRSRSQVPASSTAASPCLEKCFEFFTSLQRLGPDGYFCPACNEGEQRNEAFVGLGLLPVDPMMWWSSDTAISQCYKQAACV